MYRVLKVSIRFRSLAQNRLDVSGNLVSGKFVLTMSSLTDSTSTGRLIILFGILFLTCLYQTNCSFSSWWNASSDEQCKVPWIYLDNLFYLSFLCIKYINFSLCFIYFIWFSALYLGNSLSCLVHTPWYYLILFVQQGYTSTKLQPTNSFLRTPTSKSKYVTNLSSDNVFILSQFEGTRYLSIKNLW